MRFEVGGGTVPRTMNDADVEYKDIPGYPGYRVGDDGSVWSQRRTRRTGEWRQLKPWASKSTGRLIVSLWPERGHRLKKWQVHRIVLLAFVGPCPTGKEVCHEDGDHTDNRLANLRYDTHVANESDKVRHGRKLLGDRHPVAKLNIEMVRAIRLLLPVHTLIALADRFGVSKKTIWNVKTGRAWRWVT